MKTILLIILAIVIAIVSLLIVLFTSAYYFKLRLQYEKENLAKLPSSDEVNNLVARIDYLCAIKDVTTSVKKQMWQLLRELSHFLAQKVPCYYEHGDIPDATIIYAEDSKCRICNATSCIFHC